MSRIAIAAALVALLGAGGYFGWQAWAAQGADGAGAAAAIGDQLRSLAAPLAATDDRPVRCRVGKQMHLLRRLDCAQRRGMVLEDGGGGYTKLTKEEMAAQSGAPKAQPPAAPGEPAPDAAANAKKAGAVQ